MSARLAVESLAARAAARLSRLAGTGGGTTIPGKLLWKLDPGAIDALAARLPQGSAVISATNGKTTTTAMVAEIVGPGRRLAWNRSGANLLSGVASTLLAERDADLGLLEVDEGALREVVRRVRPRAVLLGNLFRDQLDRSPTMREFAADEQTTVHPQTVIEHFGSWNAAKRQAGLVPRRFATRDELLGRLRALGDELGRTPTARDIDARKGAMPSKSLLWHTFGSLAQALREAGFDVPVGEERLERAVEQGAALARSLGRLPKMADWADARRQDPSLLTEWQVYRMIDVQPAWAAFQYLVRERLREEDADVRPDGSLG